MTSSNTNNRSGPYAGNGSTTSYAVTFYFLQDSEITVTRSNADGSEDILTLNSDYTVSGAGNSSGGGITLSSGSVAPTGSYITITPAPSLIQPQAYPAVGNFPSKAAEQGFDRLTIIALYLLEKINRCVKLGVATQVSGALGPDISDPVAGATLVYDPALNRLVPGPTAADIANAQSNAAVATAKAAEATTQAGNAASSAAAAAAIGNMVAPQGRITTASNTPIPATEQTSITALYYTPYKGNKCPIWNGASYSIFTFAQLTLALSNTAHLNGNLYDIFAFNNNGSMAIGTGPAWSSISSRGSGAGTSEIVYNNGYPCNTNVITLKNGATTYSNIPLKQATYLGTVYITADGQTKVNFKPTPASLGSAPVVGVYNAYNRVPISVFCQDYGTWVYSTATWRPMDGSNNNRISFVDGQGQLSVISDLCITCGTSVISDNSAIGILLNANSGGPVVQGQSISPTSNSINNQQNISMSESFQAGPGLNYLQAMECSLSPAAMSMNLNGNSMSFTAQLEW